MRPQLGHYHLIVGAVQGKRLSFGEQSSVEHISVYNKSWMLVASCRDLPLSRRVIVAYCLALSQHSAYSHSGRSLPGVPGSTDALTWSPAHVCKHRNPTAAACLHTFTMLIVWLGTSTRCHIHSANAPQYTWLKGVESCAVRLRSCLAIRHIPWCCTPWLCSKALHFTVEHVRRCWQQPRTMDTARGACTFVRSFLACQDPEAHLSQCNLCWSLAWLAGYTHPA